MREPDVNSIIRFASLFTFVLVAFCSLGCSDESGNSKNAGGTSSAGEASGGGEPSAGKGGSPTAGSSAGGSSSQGGGSASGAGGSVATAGSGTGGSPNADALNPNLLKPSYDCLTASDVQCLSIRGTVDGRPVDSHCTRDFLGMATLADPPAWITSCYETTASVGLYDLVTVPVQPFGEFDYSFDPSSAYAGASVTAAYDDAGASSTGDHLVTARLKGTIQAAPDDLGVLVSGAFRLTAAAPPAAACHAGSPSKCAEVDVHGTFRFMHSRTE